MTSILMHKLAAKYGTIRQTLAGLSIGAAMIASLNGWQPLQRDNFSFGSDGTGAIVGAWTPSTHLAISLRLQVKG